MRIVMQRVRCATVLVDRQKVASIDRGILLFVGIGKADIDVDFFRIARKISELRIFEDAEGRMNRSLKDIHGEILAVSQFTLYGETKKGRRPSFTDAAPPDVAEPLFDTFIEALAGEGLSVKTGLFGAHMAVELVNDGPATFVLNLDPPLLEG
jgi:D-tyrosyl-tRNA(Tyr) deacylase